ncbi:MAG: recombinase RecA [Phycisphaerae bacterium]
MVDSQQARREAALDRAIQQIEKAYGKGSILQLDESQSASVDGIGTGSLSLDLALGGRGMPRGRIVEIFGPEASGKTTLALHVVAEAQKQDGVAAFIDAEHGFDPVWARRIGVNLEALMVNQPSCGEEALDVCELLVRSNAVDVIVIDSVAALVPKAEIEGEMGEAHVGLQARLMSQAMRKLTGAINRSRCCVLFINQIRERIGVMFGNPEITPGGRALKFYSSVRIDIRRISTIKDGQKVIGNHHRARVVKNKVAPPFREAEFDIMFDCGISREADLLDLGCAEGLIDRTGTWFTFGQVRLGQGRENAKQFLRDNPDLAEQIRSAVLSRRGIGPAPSQPQPPAAQPKAKRK